MGPSYSNIMYEKSNLANERHSNKHCYGRHLIYKSSNSQSKDNPGYLFKNSKPLAAQIAVEMDQEEASKSITR